MFVYGVLLRVWNSFFVPGLPTQPHHIVEMLFVKIKFLFALEFGFMLRSSSPSCVTDWCNLTRSWWVRTYNLSNYDGLPYKGNQSSGNFVTSKIGRIQTFLVKEAPHQASRNGYFLCWLPLCIDCLEHSGERVENLPPPAPNEMPPQFPYQPVKYSTSWCICSFSHCEIPNIRLDEKTMYHGIEYGVPWNRVLSIME